MKPRRTGVSPSSPRAGRCRQNIPPRPLRSRGPARVAYAISTGKRAVPSAEQGDGLRSSRTMPFRLLLSFRRAIRVPRVPWPLRKGPGTSARPVVLNAIPAAPAFRAMRPRSAYRRHGGRPLPSWRPRALRRAVTLVESVIDELFDTPWLRPPLSAGPDRTGLGSSPKTRARCAASPRFLRGSRPAAAFAAGWGATPLPGASPLFGEVLPDFRGHRQPARHHRHGHEASRSLFGDTCAAMLADDSARRTAAGRDGRAPKQVMAKWNSLKR